MRGRVTLREEIRNEYAEDAHIGAEFGAENSGVGGESTEPGAANGDGEAIDPTNFTGAGSTSDGAVETKGRSAAEKAAAFSRLASGRASNALDAIRGLGHLANTSQYAFTQDQVDRMLVALDASLDVLHATFAAAMAPPVDGSKKKKNRQYSFKL